LSNISTLANLPLKDSEKQFLVGLSEPALHSREIALSINDRHKHESPHMAGLEDRLSGEKKPADLAVAG
jgi:hypothetical protein